MMEFMHVSLCKKSPVEKTQYMYLPKGGSVSFLSPSHFRQLRSFPIFLLNESLLTSLERAESLTLNRFDPFTVKS